MIAALRGEFKRAARSFENSLKGAARGVGVASVSRPRSETPCLGPRRSCHDAPSIKQHNPGHSGRRTLPDCPPDANHHKTIRRILGKLALDPVEKAIRSALEKGDAQDRAFRERVYRSAFAALERATQAQPQTTVEMAIKRRQNLQAKITSIEAEFLPAAQGLPVQPSEVPAISLDEDMPAAEAAVPSVEGPSAAAREHRHLPDVSPVNSALPEGPASSISLDAAPETGHPGVDLGAQRLREPDRAPGKASKRGKAMRPAAERRPRRRRPFAAAFAIVTLLCIAVIGGWAAYELGLFGRGSDTPPAQPRLVEEDEFDPANETPTDPGDLGGSQELRNWITVFTPSDASGVNAPTGASADVSEDESGRFLRIRSGADGSNVVFDVGQGVLEEIVGKKAVFDISARGADAQQTQISISCDFGELGDCGRKRYAVGYERGEYLFDVQLPANRPGAGGSIAIDSDFAGEGKAVDIYEIRVSVVE